ncbi:MAG: OST-HTH/LOTUS domain-containing protein, partial [Microbacterium hominis]|nr:OST-HTH/LOTUS domain-containing protein [Microbacterium hominis]
VGVGVAGSTAKSLAAACDQFDAYDSLPGVPTLEKPSAKKTDAAAAPATAGSRRRKKPEDPTAELLRRALILERERTDDEWVHLSAVKNLLKRMDPSFSEKALGHRSFSDFVKAHPTIADIDETTNIVRVRLHNAEDAAAPQDSEAV